MREAAVQIAIVRRFGSFWKQHRDCICDGVGAVTLFTIFILVLYLMHGFGLSGLG